MSTRTICVVYLSQFLENAFETLRRRYPMRLLGIKTDKSKVNDFKEKLTHFIHIS